MKLLLVQGANLSCLSSQQDDSSDKTSTAALDLLLQQHAKKFEYVLDVFYANTEKEAINTVYQSVEQGIDGILSNPASFTAHAIALGDCLKAVAPPYIELHMTNIDQRNIRSVISPSAVGVVQGFGIDTYFIALEAMLRILVNR